jgi:NAD(P)H dehydrogenase (quinone)
MHLGIIIHSQSGHTATVAKAIAEKFRQNGHEVDIKLLMTTGMAKPGSKKFSICNAPEQEEIDGYEAILFGGPVWAFRSSPVIQDFLTWLKKLNGKKVLSFVTHGLPSKSFGATRAIAAMNGELEASGGTVLQGEMLHYFFGINRKKLAEALERIYKGVTAK